jgi:ABC-type transport system involved in multi-copper enzyme maturation permease subunit
MRLLRAELAKLRRPLVVWVALVMMGSAGLVAWGGIDSAAGAYRSGIRTGGGPPGPSCAELRAEGEECRRRQEAVRAALRAATQEQASAAGAARIFQHPIGMGRLAAGMTASLPGVIALLLLAAGHIGGEWSGRTLTSVLAQERRRWRVVAAKLASLWLLGVGLLLTTWLGLIPLAIGFRWGFELPGSPMSSTDAWAQAWPAAVRSLLVIAATAALGTLAGVVARGTLGAVLLGFAVVALSMIAASFHQLARVTLAYWVAGWMKFRQQSLFPDHLWNDSFPQGVPLPTVQAGLWGLTAVILLASGAALVTMARADVTV